ncbi:MAG TPA: ribosome maturation factor RimM [Alphaproteobacteria bacterium]|nr:ribosome maturation factor RimM [Alphaproteobacteria bacterium]
MAAKAGETMLCLGQIVGVHGIRGEVKIKSFTAVPADVAAYGALSIEGGASFTLRMRGVKGQVVVAALEGVAGRGEAEKLRGRKLYVPRARLPKVEKGRFYVEDLKGMAAVDESGRQVARVTDVQNFGAGDILAMETPEGREYLLPFKPPYAGAPDMEKRQVVVSIPADFPFSQVGKKSKGLERDKKQKTGHARDLSAEALAKAEGGHPRKAK